MEPADTGAIKQELAAIHSEEKAQFQTELQAIATYSRLRNRFVNIVMAVSLAILGPVFVIMGGVLLGVLGLMGAVALSLIVGRSVATMRREQFIHKAAEIEGCSADKLRAELDEIGA